MTDTPGIKPPEESFTMPEIDAVDCASAAVEVITTNTNDRSPWHTRRDIATPLLR
jgi:hypothetical protein